MIKRCLVCGTLTDINNSTAADGLAEQQCQRCLNSSKALSLKKSSPVRSLFYVFDGFTSLFKSAKLFRLSLFPLLISTLVLMIIYGTFLFLFISGLNQYLPSGEEQGILINGSRYLLGLFGSLLIAIILLFLFLPVSSIICIPFNDIISLETEKLLLGEQEQANEPGKFLDEVKVGVREMVKLLGFKLLILVLSLPLILIPVAGWGLFLFVLALITAIDFLDVVMARKKYDLREKIGFIKMNKLSFIMFSIPFLLLFWIPLVQIFIIPAAAIAGTRFFLEADKEN